MDARCHYLLPYAACPNLCSRLCAACPADVKNTQTTGPVLIHVITDKGRGYDPAISASDRMHGVGKFDKSTGKQFKTKSKVSGAALRWMHSQMILRMVAYDVLRSQGTISVTCYAVNLWSGCQRLPTNICRPDFCRSLEQAQAQSYTNYFADAMLAEAERDSRIIGIHAAMGGGTGMNRFSARFPERTFDVGIAEQHAVGRPTLHTQHIPFL